MSKYVEQFLAKGKFIHRIDWQKFSQGKLSEAFLFRFTIWEIIFKAKVVINDKWEVKGIRKKMLLKFPKVIDRFDVDQKKIIFNYLFFHILFPPHLHLYNSCAILSPYCYTEILSLPSYNNPVLILHTFLLHFTSSIISSFQTLRYTPLESIISTFSLQISIFSTPRTPHLFLLS